MIKISILYKKKFGGLIEMMELLHHSIMVDHSFNIAEDHYQKHYYVSFDLEIDKWNEKNFRKNFIHMLKTLKEHDVFADIPPEVDLHHFGFGKEAAPTLFCVEDDTYPIIYDDICEYRGDISAKTIRELNIKKSELDKKLEVDIPDDQTPISLASSINADLPPPALANNNRGHCLFQTEISAADVLRRILGIGTIALTFGFVIPITAIISERKPEEILNGYYHGYRF